MKKILLIGNPNSQWLKEFITNSLLNLNVSIYVAGFGEIEDKSFFDNLNITIFKEDFCCEKKWIIHELKRWRYVFKLFLNGPYEIINIHYVTFSGLKLAYLLKGRKCRKIASYYGSDLLRNTDQELNSYQKFLNSFSTVTFDSIDLKKRFEQVYGTAFLNNKKELIYLGLSTLESIERCMQNNTKEEVKRKLGINENSIVIAIGYNRIKEQQHLEVLDQIKKLPEKLLKEKITILLQMTYGMEKDPGYMERVIERAVATGSDVKVYKDFLDEETISMLRVATDIYINAQITDAFSGSICEILYAKNVLLNAAWLHYSELDQYQMSYVEFRTFDELTCILQKCINKEYDLDLEYNKDKIAHLRMWRYVNKQWYSIYNIGGF